MDSRAPLSSRLAYMTSPFVNASTGRVARLWIEQGLQRFRVGIDTGTPYDVPQYRERFCVHIDSACLLVGEFEAIGADHLSNRRADTLSEMPLRRDEKVVDVSRVAEPERIAVFEQIAIESAIPAVRFEQVGRNRRSLYESARSAFMEEILPRRKPGRLDAAPLQDITQTLEGNLVEGTLEIGFEEVAMPVFEVASHFHERVTEDKSEVRYLSKEARVRCSGSDAGCIRHAVSCLLSYKPRRGLMSYLGHFALFG